MHRFKQFSIIKEDLDKLNYNKANENAFVLGLLGDIDDKIGSVQTEISLDTRSNKTNSKKLGISQLMADKDRNKYAGLAIEVIEKHPDLERIKVSSGRKGKDYAFKYKDMDRYVYINCRPLGKRSGAGDDPNELMTAALCLKSSLKAPQNSDEMDKLIDEVKLGLGGVKGYKQGQVDALTGDYPNLCQAVSAALACHAAGYGGADKVYLTGQSWDDDVKQFKISKHGMNDFNSSDFIIKKGNRFLGVSLKKKKRLAEEDPTLINKSFSTLFTDKKFSKVMDQLDRKAGEFYTKVIKTAARKKLLDKEMMADLKKDRPTPKNWKQYIQRVPNSLINAELKTSRSLFKDMAKIIMAQKDLIANQLVQLIFKADLKDLQKVNFDFALVTGIGDYGPSKGVVVEKGEYKDINTVTSKLDDLFSTGKVDLKFTPGATQAFDQGAGAAVLKFDLLIGKLPLCNIILRYKGNFRAAPSFLATMTPQFKAIYK